MIISAIVATAKNRVIGKNNDIPWRLSSDLKYFKKTTLERHILMGRKSFESIGKPLPKRENIIVTSNPYYIATGCYSVPSIEEGIRFAKENGEKELFIIGGGTIYEQSLPYCHKLYLTEVDCEPEGDVFFPELEMSDWILNSEEPHKAGEKDDFNFNFKVYSRVGDVMDPFADFEEY